MASEYSSMQNFTSFTYPSSHARRKERQSNRPDTRRVSSRKKEIRLEELGVVSVLISFCPHGFERATKGCRVGQEGEPSCASKCENREEN